MYICDCHGSFSPYCMLVAVSSPEALYNVSLWILPSSVSSPEALYNVSLWILPSSVSSPEALYNVSLWVLPSSTASCLLMNLYCFLFLVFCFLSSERVINRTLVNVNGKKVNLQIWWIHRGLLHGDTKIWILFLSENKIHIFVTQMSMIM